MVRNLDTLMIISDPTARGMETAAVIRDMVDQDHIIECRRKGIVFNRVRDDGRLLRESAERLGLDLFGLVPQDETIAEYDLQGRPIVSLPQDAAGPKAVREIVERVVLTG